MDQSFQLPTSYETIVKVSVNTDYFVQVTDNKSAMLTRQTAE